MGDFPYLIFLALESPKTFEYSKKSLFFLIFWTITVHGLLFNRWFEIVIYLMDYWELVLKPQYAFHIKTIQFIHIENQLTVF